MAPPALRPSSSTSRTRPARLIIALSVGCLAARFAALLRRATGRAATFAVDHSVGAAETASRLLSWRLVIAILLALIALAWSIKTRPFPASGEDPLLGLVEIKALPSTRPSAPGTFCSRSRPNYQERRRTERRMGRHHERESGTGRWNQRTARGTCEWLSRFRNGAVRHPTPGAEPSHEARGTPPESSSCQSIPLGWARFSRAECCARVICRSLSAFPSRDHRIRPRLMC